MDFGYFCGFGVPMDYDEVSPNPYYCVFYHPIFDYLQDNGEVVNFNTCQKIG